MTSTIIRLFRSTEEEYQVPGSDSGSLREALGATRDPEFELKLPDGWERHVPDDADKASLDASLKRRLMSVNRPDLHASLRVQLDQAFANMKEQSVVAYFAATKESESGAYLPGSIVATIRRSPSGESLDEYVTHAIREYGAEPLFGDKRFIRFERESTKTVDGGPLDVTTIVYVTPIPGSNRRRGLQLSATIVRDPETSADDRNVITWKTALDICVSTLRWTSPVL